MLAEHDRIVLTDDLRDDRLKDGDAGTIVHVHRDGEAFEVEFLALDGNTATVATVPASEAPSRDGYRPHPCASVEEGRLTVAQIPTGTGTR